MIVIAGLGMSAWFVLQILSPIKLEQTDFEINDKEGVHQIGYNLIEHGIIKNFFVFDLYVYLKGVDSEFKAGKYKLPGVINIKKLVDIFINGGGEKTGLAANEWELTVVEGWTVEDINSKLVSLGIFQNGEFLAEVKLSAEKYSSWADVPRGADLEGYLFPDTYRFFIDDSIGEVVGKMLDNFDHKLTREMRDEIKKRNKTIFEIVTMASIVEREVRTAADRPIVAGIFWKRLATGMPLQADSTINYVTGKKTPAVSADDLETDTLYNTYKYKGLPPGPISNPGAAAIEAAIYPTETAYWFFLTDEAGQVHYAKTFEEHVENKEKYLK